MSTRQLVDELGRLAGGAEPPPLDDTGARRMIERAMLARPDRVPERRPIGWSFAVAALACAAIILWLVPRGSSTQPELLRLTLPTGDHLVGLAGARFDVERLEPADRKLRLRHGTVLLDVAHLVAGQRFAVTTEHLVATAKGTVFSVETDAAHSIVRVYEGVVEVTQDGARHALAAGAAWDSRSQLAVVLERPAVLSAAVDEAIRERHEIAATGAQATRAVTPPQTPSPPVADTPPSPAGEVIPPRPPAEPSQPPHKRAVETQESSADLVEQARAAVTAAKFEAALALLDRAKTHGGLTGEAWVVMADALRGLARVAEAADAFDAAAGALTGPDMIEAAYTASYLRFHDLRDANAALASLAASVDAEGSPLEERGLGLRARILESLGRHTEARAIAERYLVRFAHGELRATMLVLAKTKD